VKSAQRFSSKNVDIVKQVEIGLQVTSNSRQCNRWKPFCLASTLYCGCR